MGKKSEYANNKDGVIKSRNVDKQAPKAKAENGGDLRVGHKKSK